MDRPIGSKAKLNNKDVVWSGSEYGWQSPASHLKLKNQGHFAIGRKELDAVGRFFAPAVTKIRDFQQQVKHATPWLDPVENTVNRAVRSDDRLPSSRIAQGGAIAAQRAGQAANLDPRLTIGIPMLLGAVHTSGPRAGTTKLKPRRDLKIDHGQLEDLVEGGYQHVKQTGGLKGYKATVPLPDGQEAVVFNRGNVDFDGRNGLTIKTRPAAQTAKAVAEGKPAPKPIITEAPPKQTYDPNARFTPTKSEPSDLSSAQRRTANDKLIRNPNLPRDLSPSVTTAPVAGGGLAIRAQGPAVRGTALAGQNYANAHLSEGSQPFIVKEAQAHHEVPLKDAADFMSGMTDEQINTVRSAAEAESLYFGDTQLNTLYPRQPYHQGDARWPEAQQQAAHVNLKNKVLEAESGTSRWAQFTPEQRMEMLGMFIQDAKDGRRIGQNAVYQQQVLQPGNNAETNPFGGNFAQEVLAPQSLAALKIIANKRRNAREALKVAR